MVHSVVIVASQAIGSTFGTRTPFRTPPDEEKMANLGTVVFSCCREGRDQNQKGHKTSAIMVKLSLNYSNSHKTLAVSSMLSKQP